MLAAYCPLVDKAKRPCQHIDIARGEHVQSGFTHHDVIRLPAQFCEDGMEGEIWNGEGNCHPIS